MTDVRFLTLIHILIKCDKDLEKLTDETGIRAPESEEKQPVGCGLQENRCCALLVLYVEVSSLSLPNSHSFFGSQFRPHFSGEACPHSLD